MSLRSLISLLIILPAMVLALPPTAMASDHGDEHRGAANIGDFYIFQRGPKLVLAMTVMADLPIDMKQFHFPHDVVYRFMIDRNAQVKFNDANAVREYGGTIVQPDKIREDITIEVRFSGGSQEVRASGLKGTQAQNLMLFSGIRDEPFIRGGFDRRNIACIVVELPMSAVLSPQDLPTILAWCTTDTTEAHQQTDLGGHPYRSQTLVALNSLHPSEHQAKLHVPPDVFIYNTEAQAKYPNGRELADDVVDAFFSNEEIVRRHGSNPSQNDVPFLDSFPYLAPAHVFKPGDFPGPPDNMGAYTSSVAAVNLEKLLGIPGRNARLRYWTVAPGGVFGQHYHDKRPSMVYLLEGTLIETKKDEDGSIKTRVIHANEIFLEPTGVTHWLVNPTQQQVKMVVVDIFAGAAASRIAPGAPRTDVLAEPMWPAANATESLAQYDLGQQLPEVEQAKPYIMRAVRIQLLPGQRSPVVSSKDRPQIAYVVSGNIMEQRSDEETAVRRAGECSVISGGATRFWENLSGEPATVFIVEFIRKDQQ